MVLNTHRCHTVLHNGREGRGGSEPLSKVCKGKEAAALGMACNGISQKGCERAAVPCTLSTARRKIPPKAQRNVVPQSLKRRGGGGSRGSGS